MEDPLQAVGWGPLPGERRAASISALTNTPQNLARLMFLNFSAEVHIAATHGIWDLVYYFTLENVASWTAPLNACERKALWHDAELAEPVQAFEVARHYCAKVLEIETLGKGAPMTDAYNFECRTEPKRLPSMALLVPDKDSRQQA